MDNKVKLIIAMALISIACFASEYPPGLYLQVTEISDGLPVDIWTLIADPAEAEAKLSGVLAEHFAGKQYEARLHWHYLDKPCVVEIIATGTGGTP